SDRPNYTTSVKSPSWIDPRHLLITGSGVGSYTFQTWQPGLGDDYLQWWASDYDAIDDDSELSPDGTKPVSVAQTDGALSAAPTPTPAPSPSGTPAPVTGPAAFTYTAKVPHRLTHGRRLTVRLQLSAPSKVKLTVCRKAGKRCLKTGVRRSVTAQAGTTKVKL